MMKRSQSSLQHAVVGLRSMGNRWDRVLLAAILATTIAGLALVVAPTPMTAVLTWIAFKKSVSPVPDGDARHYLHLVQAMMGAVMVGWSVTGGVIALGPLHRREPWAWNALAASVTAWFVIAAGFSLATGFWGYVVFNTIIAGLFGLPLGMVHIELPPSKPLPFDAPPWIGGHDPADHGANPRPT